MDLPVLNLQRFAKRILELLGVEGEAELQIEKLADGSIRISREENQQGSIKRLSCPEE